MKEKIAIVGGGFAGLCTAYLLNEKYDITLFEKDGRVGGNAHTLTTSCGLDFDIAVAVFGKTTYLNFNKLLQKLGVETCRFSGGGAGLRNLDTGKEAYLSPTIRGWIAQRFAMFHPRVFLPLKENFRIYSKGKEYFEDGKFHGLTMREAFMLLPRLRGDFKLLHMLVLSLVSSMYYEEVMDAPANFFFGKMATHTDFFENPVFGMMQSKGNTKSYVNALASHFEDNIVLNSRIKSIARKEKEVVLKMEDGSSVNFNKVVFACNADQALNLLEQPTDDEKKFLGPWKYKNGPIVVHTDRSSFSEKEYYNLFTFLYTKREGKIHTSVNGHIRNLKSVPDDCKYISSQHPNFPIDENLIEYSKVFRTPIYTAESFATIKQLPNLNGKMNSYYCGSHFGYGLHEDCITSALTVARMLGVEWH